MPFTSLLEAEEHDCCFQYGGFGAYSQGRTKGRAKRAAAGGAMTSCRKYGASKLRFPHVTEFLRKLSAIWTRAFKHFRQPYLRPKKFKELV